MPTDEEALLAQVYAAPDEDAPRLVYADWLSSQGDPRGEFITLQCRLAATPDDEARRKLRIAENKLLAAHGEAWRARLLSAVPRRDPGYATKVEFHRGFPEFVTVLLEALEDLEPLFTAAPLLQRLRVEPPPYRGVPMQPPSLDGCLDSPRLLGVRELELFLPALGNAGVLPLAQSTQLRGLRALTLRASAWRPGVPDAPALFLGEPEQHVLSDPGAIALARSPHLVGLRSLDLSSNGLGAAGVRALASAPWKLESLWLSANPLDDAALVALAEGSSLKSLKHLALAGVAFGRAGLDALARSKTLSALTMLDLTDCLLGPEFAARFFEALRLPSLTSLVLERCALTDVGLGALLAAPVARQLTSLVLGHNRITAKGVEALATSRALPNLRRLLLNDPYLKKAAVLDLLTNSEPLAACRIHVKGRLLARSKPGAKAKAATPARAKKPRTPPR